MEIIALVFVFLGTLLLNKSLKNKKSGYAFLGGLMGCLGIDIIFLAPPHDWLLVLIIEIILLVLLSLGLLITIIGILRRKRIGNNLLIFFGLSFIVNYALWIVFTSLNL